MGTCMSKDNKAAAAPQKPSPSQQQHQQQQNVSPPLNVQRPLEACPSPEKQPSSLPHQQPFSSMNAAYSDFNAVVFSPDTDKESTDKHVVEICLPLSSPRKPFASSSKTSRTGDASAVSDNCDNEANNKRDASPLKHSQGRKDCFLPLFYTNYLPANLASSRASFSRDLSSFSRDLSALDASFDPRARASSPLKRSPSINGAHMLIRTSSIKASSPLRSGPQMIAKLQVSMKDYPDGYSTTRSRSLPKRLSSRESELDVPLHKRSSSRDTATESVLVARKPPSALRRIPSVDSSLDTNLSPRLSLRREEASGEYRVHARHSAAKKTHTHDLNSANVSEAFKSRKKEKSPLRRCSNGKVANAEPPSNSDLNLVDQNLAKVSQVVAMIQENQRGRLALNEKPVNCSYASDAASTKGISAKQGVNGMSKSSKTLKDAKTNLCEQLKDQEPVQFGRSAFNEELHVKDLHVKKGHENLPEAADDLHTMLESQMSCKNFLYPTVDSVPSESLEGNLTVPASISKAHSILEAVADLSMASSIYSGMEESETEVEEDVDLLQFMLEDELPPKKDIQAQQARNLLLKEAAMEAFARPNLQSTMNARDFEESKPSGKDMQFAALMAMKLTKAEAETLDIGRALELLSRADSTKRPDNNAVFYNEMKMLLDNVRTPDYLVEKKLVTNGVPVFDEEVSNFQEDPQFREKKLEEFVYMESTGSSGMEIELQKAGKVAAKNQIIDANGGNCIELKVVMTDLASQSVTDLEVESKQDDKTLETCGNSDVTNGSLLAELSDVHTSKMMTREIQSHDNCALESQKHQSIVENGQSLLQAAMISGAESISGQGIFDHEKDQSTPEIGVQSVQDIEVDLKIQYSVVTCPDLAPSCTGRKWEDSGVAPVLEQLRIRESVGDIDSRATENHVGDCIGKSEITAGHEDNEKSGQDHSWKIYTQKETDGCDVALRTVADIPSKDCTDLNKERDSTENRDAAKNASSKQCDYEAFDSVNATTRDTEKDQSKLMLEKKEKLGEEAPAVENTSETKKQAPMAILPISDSEENQPPKIPLATLDCTTDTREILSKDVMMISIPLTSSAQGGQDAAKDARFHRDGAEVDDGLDTFLGNAKPSPSSDAASEGSFEFRIRSTMSTPQSTPSTPMISTASTPRQLNNLNPALTAEEIAEIWDAFE